MAFFIARDAVMTGLVLINLLVDMNDFEAGASQPVDGQRARSVCDVSHSVPPPALSIDRSLVGLENS